MLFTSADYLVFLFAVFLLYWLFARHTIFQNILIVAASYLFYAWWDWRFPLFLLLITCSDYFFARCIYHFNELSKKRFFLYFSLSINLGLLFTFKYYNFFIASFISGLEIAGIKIPPAHLDIIVPLGISFIVFQSLSYIFDVYLEKIEPVTNFITYAAFLSYFPKLIMGPIEKPGNLLPQLSKHRQFDYSLAVDGLWQILWGLFNKIVIADNVAIYVNEIFGSYQQHNGSTILLAALLYTFQIYCDFSGYSNIAIGSAKLFGFRLNQNFAYPYFSKNIAEFWRRWHISLSNWLQSYIFRPLQMKFRSVGNFANAAAILITFLVCGIWHGANWTFILWGLYNGILFLPLLLLKNKTTNKTSSKGYKNISKIAGMFILVVFGWIIFRAESINQAAILVRKIFSRSLFEFPYLSNFKSFVTTFSFIILMIMVEWFQQNRPYGLDILYLKRNRAIRWGVSLVIIWLIILFGAEQEAFIYFKF